MNEAAEIIHAVAHPDANIIFGSVIDDTLGDYVRVTVIAAGFDRFDTAEEPRKASMRPARSATPPRPAGAGEPGAADLTGAVPRQAPAADRDVFDVGDDDLDLGDDDFDVPSFLR